MHKDRTAEFWEMALFLLADPPLGAEKISPHVLHVLSHLLQL